MKMAVLYWPRQWHLVSPSLYIVQFFMFRGGDREMSTLCWKWKTMVKAQIGVVVGDALMVRTNDYFAKLISNVISSLQVVLAWFTRSTHDILIVQIWI
jgi:hypothetical protein